MSIALIDIDDEALTRAAAVLGTSTPEETVNAALRQMVERARRMSALRVGAPVVSPDTPGSGDPREEREP
ncbi:type II toxin-antitoxin system VapB family antitoxin [Nocardiopsis sp. EMB25]|uniref:type II toxin-antitoxin system VapB family antitoxin n=1 Tax=Nocardiopsis sp. EMB25 TaxID=2835867 RepID=UPI002E1019F6